MVRKEETGESITGILQEDERRREDIDAVFNPYTGEGAILERVPLRLSDFSLPVQYVPKSMQDVPLVRRLGEAGSVSRFLTDFMQVEDSAENREKVVEAFTRLRCEHDFCFWAAFYVMIKAKGGGADIHFRLNRQQRRLVERFERMRLAGKPIRLILLKARQWGGSTVTQIYMAWLQMMHRPGLNSLIIAHQGAGSDEIQDMFNRMIAAYPLPMLYEQGAAFSPSEPKFVGVGKSGSIHRVPQRNCKIKIGTAERPDSCRGGDYNLVHLSEVAIWKTTDGKKPEDIVRSACSGILLRPYTMIVYESTANGTGNFFQVEYDAAVNGRSQFEAMFVAWYEIEQYALPFDSEAHRTAFARRLWENRNNEQTDSDREEPGRYLWWLWEKGATLEAIHWYVAERSKYHDHGDMASEYPSDDVEAFVHSGERVFDRYRVEELRRTCRAAKFRGEVYSLKGDDGADAMRNLRFSPDAQGALWVWAKPERDDGGTWRDRYLTVVDIGGRSLKADWSVIVVFDRLFMADGGKPSVVAQWYGHIDMDLLAWKAAQIAAWYDNALLVIESNTLETHDRERRVDGDQSGYILNQLRDVYPNLYHRRQSEEEIAEKAPKKYGFHTNVATKPLIISTLVKTVREGLYTERDERCLFEMLTYERKKNGAYGAIQGKHDDLLMTRAIGLHICFREMPLPRFIPIEKQKAKTHKNVVSAATM